MEDCIVKSGGIVLFCRVQGNQEECCVMSLVSMGKCHELARLIANGVDVIGDPWPEARWKAIHLACAWNRPECLQLLIEAGGDIDEPCRYMGRAPLLHAAAFKSKECVRILLANGADVNCCTPESYYFFEELCKHLSDIELVKAVIQQGVNVRNFECESVLKQSSGRKFKKKLRVILRAMGGIFSHDRICSQYNGKAGKPKMLKQLCCENVKEKLLLEHQTNLLVIVPKTNYSSRIKKMLTNGFVM